MHENRQRDRVRQERDVECLHPDRMEREPIVLGSRRTTSVLVCIRSHRRANTKIASAESPVHWDLEHDAAAYSMLYARESTVGAADGRSDVTTPPIRIRIRHDVPGEVQEPVSRSVGARVVVITQRFQRCLEHVTLDRAVLRIREGRPGAPRPVQHHLANLRRAERRALPGAPSRLEEDGCALEQGETW